MFEANVSNIISPLCLKTKSQLYDAYPNLSAWEAAAESLCWKLVGQLPGKTLSQKKKSTINHQLFLFLSLSFNLAKAVSHTCTHPSSFVSTCAWGSHSSKC